MEWRKQNRKGEKAKQRCNCTQIQSDPERKLWRMLHQTILRELPGPSKQEGGDEPIKFRKDLVVYQECPLDSIIHLESEKLCQRFISVKFYKFVMTHLLLGAFRIVVQRKSWPWSQRHRNLNPNPVIYQQRGSTWPRNQYPYPQMHTQTSNAPSQAQLLSCKFDIWNFSTISQLNLRFLLLSSRDVLIFKLISHCKLMGFNPI